MKELLKKKSVKIVLLLILLLVVMGIVGMNASSAQRRKDYNGYVDAAEKYLTELNYEQAIAEYTLALEIEPNSKEILDALEENYLAYAQTYADMEEFESAIEILERGYEQIGRESLHRKIEEVKNFQAQREAEEEQQRLEEEASAGMIEFPFELTDITIMGYDIFSDHYEEICAAYGVPLREDGHGSTNNEYGWVDGRVHDDLTKGFTISSDVDHILQYFVWDIDVSGKYSILLNLESEFDLEFYGINVPIGPEGSDEDWNRIMSVQEIKEKGHQRDGIGDQLIWEFQTKWGRGVYGEHIDDNGAYAMFLTIYLDEGDGYYNTFDIDKNNLDGAIPIEYKFVQRQY